MGTNTQEEIQRRQDGIRSDEWFHRCLRLIERPRLVIILTVHSVISAPPMCNYMHIHIHTVPFTCKHRQPPIS